MDFDDDGILDLVAGDTSGQVWIFKNTGTRAKPVLAEGSPLQAGGKTIRGKEAIYKQVNGQYVVDKTTVHNSELAEIYSKLHVADWNGDGLKDVLVGAERTIVLYANVGQKGKPEYMPPVLIEAPEGQFPMRPSPFVVDWDDDGKPDLMVGVESGPMVWYRNEGDARNPKLGAKQVINLQGDGFEQSYRLRLTVTDWNNDGKKDLLVGNFFSRHETGQQSKMGGNVWLFKGK